MALKDWKKMRSKNINKIEFVNNKKLVYLTIFTDHLWFNDEWRVNAMQIKNRQMNIIESKQFESKSQALNFAKSYMSRH